jgi:hypothetical protein
VADLQVVICQFSTLQCSISFLIARIKQLSVKHAPMGERTVMQEAVFYQFSLDRHVPGDHPSIGRALTGTKSVPALFSSRPDVRRLVHTAAKGNPRGRHAKTRDGEANGS